MGGVFFSKFLENIILFNNVTILSSALIIVVSIIASFYNSILYGSVQRNIAIFTACLCSVLAIVSQNFILTFISIELLSICCFVLILLSKKVKRRVALSYFLIHAFSGVLMIVAIAMYYNEVQSFKIIKSPSLAFSKVSLKEIIMLTSLVINAALFPFANWFVKTYSRTDSFSLILLSVITTKTAFFVLWKIIPGGSILFYIGLITLVISTFLALITQNIIKFMLLASVASLGFDTMAISYHSIQFNEDITSAIIYQLVWYISSGSLAICGFLVLYGFITNHECHNKSFHSIKEYFRDNGSSIHFVIPLILFGLCYAGAPFSAAALSKTNIVTFFVEEKLVYLVLKSSQVIFIMFAIKLIAPALYGVEMFKLDKIGKKISTVLYIFSFLLVLLNLAFIFLSKIKFTILGVSIEFFTFIAYTCIAGLILMMLEFLFKFTKAKLIIERAIYGFNLYKFWFFRIIRKIGCRCREGSEGFNSKRILLGEVLIISKVTPSFLIGIIVMSFVFLYIIINF